MYPLLEQHLDGDISNAYLAVAGDWYIRRNIVWAGKDIEDSGYSAAYEPLENLIGEQIEIFENYHSVKSIPF